MTKKTKTEEQKKLFVCTGYRRMKQLVLVTVEAKNEKEAEDRAVRYMSTIADRDSKLVKVVKEEVFLDDSQCVDDIHEVEIG